VRHPTGSCLLQVAYACTTWVSATGECLQVHELFRSIPMRSNRYVVSHEIPLVGLQVGAWQNRSPLLLRHLPRPLSSVPASWRLHLDQHLSQPRCHVCRLSSTTQLNNHFYAQSGGTSTTCDLGFQTQYECCIQTCQADTDCLAGYYCQSGSDAGSVCTLCEACGVTTSAQCMAALNCQSSCCLNPSRDSCYIPGLGGITQFSIFNAETCCPTSPSTYAFDGQACGCGSTPQLCPALPPPLPQESPSPLDSSPELLLSVPPPPSPLPVVSHMTVDP